MRKYYEQMYSRQRFRLLRIIPIGKYPALVGRSTRIYRMEVLDRTGKMPKMRNFLLYSKKPLADLQKTYQTHFASFERIPLCWLEDKSGIIEDFKKPEPDRIVPPPKGKSGDFKI